MEIQNEEKRELSEQVDGSTSVLGTSRHSQDRDHGETIMSLRIDRVVNACEDPHDLNSLIRLATAPGGLINDELRKVACTFGRAETPLFRR